MKKRLALAAALAFSIIPFASIEEAKASHDYKELENMLKNVTWRGGVDFGEFCYHKKKEKTMWLALKENKYGEAVVKFKGGKKFHKGRILKEAKEAFLNQYKKKCSHPRTKEWKKYLKQIKKQQSQ